MAKERIIVYGIWSLEIRRAIEFFLDEKNYEIIGYSDTNADSDTLDHRSFFKTDELSKVDFDYILIAAIKYADRIIEVLHTYGISDNKILIPDYLLPDTLIKKIPDRVRTISSLEKNYDSLILGMSYSFLGIDKNLLNFSCLDLSAPSLDLYYNLRLCEFFLRQKRHIFEAIRNIYIVIPYYFFNFDMSLSTNAYINGCQASIAGLGDWHNSDKNPVASKYIPLIKMFSEKITEFYDCNDGYFLYQNCVSEEHSLTWKSVLKNDYEDTISENIQISKSLLNLFSSANRNIFFIVPPAYVVGLDEKSLEGAERKKNRFYKIIDELRASCDCGFELVDCFELFGNDGALFFDADHLNNAGQKKFTEYINATLIDVKDA
ncbi:MAG: hypothetical protein J5476_07215 [Lachnospiraceae bacterium]|nr:hypothetical protein [Lachnospiraceae bacterium]